MGSWFLGCRCLCVAKPLEGFLMLRKTHRDGRDGTQSHRNLGTGRGRPSSTTACTKMRMQQEGVRPIQEVKKCPAIFRTWKFLVKQSFASGTKPTGFWVPVSFPLHFPLATLGQCPSATKWVPSKVALRTLPGSWQGALGALHQRCRHSRAAENARGAG